MVSMSRIKEFSRQIGHEFHAQRVVLFGSYAESKVHEDSDVDLLVIVPFEGSSVEQSVAIRLKLRPGFPVDLIVRTPEKILQRLEKGDDFIRQILEQGKVLYEADNS